MASTQNLKRKDPISAWKHGFHENYRRAYNGNLNSYLKMIHYHSPWRMRRITSLEQKFRKMFVPKKNNLPPYIYRGLHTGPSKVNTKFGYSSWTSSLETAKQFGRGGYGTNKRGTILRINTKLLRDIPVLNLRNYGESEIVLPPLQVNLNRETLEKVNNNRSNTYFVPVTNITINSKFLIRKPTRMNRVRALFRRSA